MVFGGYIYQYQSSMACKPSTWGSPLATGTVVHFLGNNHVLSCIHIRKKNGRKIWEGISREIYHDITHFFHPSVNMFFLSKNRPYHAILQFISDSGRWLSWQNPGGIRPLKEHLTGIAPHRSVKKTPRKPGSAPWVVRCAPKKTIIYSDSFKSLILSWFGSKGSKLGQKKQQTWFRPKKVI